MLLKSADQVSQGCRTASVIMMTEMCGCRSHPLKVGVRFLEPCIRDVSRTGCHVFHMVLCARRSTRCGAVFLFSHALSQVGSKSLWSRSWQTLCRRSWTVCSMCHGRACSIASWSRSWMCQCHRSWRKSWSLLLVRSSATLAQSSGDSTGGRAQIEQVVDVSRSRLLK